MQKLSADEVRKIANETFREYLTDLQSRILVVRAQIKETDKALAELSLFVMKSDGDGA